MPDLSQSKGEAAVWAKLIVFCALPVAADHVFKATYVELGLCFLASSFLQALIPPRRKGLVQILTASSIFPLLALVLQWQYHIK